jgi:hypothetical protein
MGRGVAARLGSTTRQQSMPRYAKPLRVASPALSAIELLVRRGQSQADRVAPLEALGEREPLWHATGARPLGLRPAAALAGAGGAAMSAGILARLCQTLKLPSVARAAGCEGPRRLKLPAGRDLGSSCCNACRQKSMSGRGGALRAACGRPASHG